MTRSINPEVPIFIYLKFRSKDIERSIQGNIRKIPGVGQKWHTFLTYHSEMSQQKVPRFFLGRKDYLQRIKNQTCVRLSPTLGTKN